MSFQPKMILIGGVYYSMGTRKAKEFLSRTMEPGATPPQTQPLIPTHSQSKSEGLKALKRIRQDGKPLLNKLETEFRDHLILLNPLRVVIPQSMRFKLANGLWYKPDFVTLCGMEETSLVAIKAYEVKGPFAHRGGFENLKMAAHQFQWIRWSLVWKDGGMWHEQDILP